MRLNGSRLKIAGDVGKEEEGGEKRKRKTVLCAVCLPSGRGAFFSAESGKTRRCSLFLVYIKLRPSCYITTPAQLFPKSWCGHGSLLARASPLPLVAWSNRFLATSSDMLCTRDPSKPPLLPHTLTSVVPCREGLTVPRNTSSTSRCNPPNPAMVNPSRACPPVPVGPVLPGSFPASQEGPRTPNFSCPVHRRGQACIKKPGLAPTVDPSLSQPDLV
ncbi:hypothetical protein GGS23DRAFT_560563, partial [Durotheca rogersii]|uniref:uncharacterized protein n=1 Tax=Durotheca rogersii TaxID=419775 RepID=UPI00221EED89